MTTKGFSDLRKTAVPWISSPQPDQSIEFIWTLGGQKRGRYCLHQCWNQLWFFSGPSAPGLLMSPPFLITQSFFFFFPFPQHNHIIKARQYDQRIFQHLLFRVIRASFPLCVSRLSFQKADNWSNLSKWDSCWGFTFLSVQLARTNASQ